MKPNKSANEENETIRCMMEQGYTRALSQSLMKFGKQSFPLRIWVVDNSGSMNVPDGKRLVETKRRNDVRWRHCTRWAELKECVRYHAQLSALLEAPTKFRLLNGVERDLGVGEMGPDMMEEEVESVFRVLDRTKPGGATPLTKHLNDIYDTLSPIQNNYRAEGQQVVVVLATDGLPSDMSGWGGPGAQREFELALKRLLRDMPVWVVVRLCTDEDEVVSYYEKLDTQLELNLEVLDDFESEAKEVYKQNPWLTYALPLHRCREMGFRHHILDLLDERPLTVEEVVECLQLIFGGDWSDVEPHTDLKAFLTRVDKAVRAEDKQYNPVCRRLTRWVDMGMLRRKYSPSPKLTDMILIIVVVLAILVRCCLELW